MWIDSSQRRVKIFFEGETRVLQFGSENLAAPHITLAPYIDLVVQMLLSFGLAFQTPLVVLALVRVNIVTIEQFKAMRGIVYFAITILSAMIVPDVATGMLALMFPLFGLFELGLLLARIPAKSEPVEEK
jgi:sec-independent protein translocase protein TatC